MYKITFIDNGKTFKWSLRKCNQVFGEYEFMEILGGSLPHIIAVKIS